MGVKYGAVDEPDDQPNEEPSSDDTLTEPTSADSQKPMLSKFDIFVLNLSWYGLNLMFLLLSVEVVPAQIQSLVGPASKGRWFGGIVAGGAIVMFLTGPLIGMASDRITSRFGRRRPCMFIATIGLCIGMAGMALSAPKIIFKNPSENTTSPTCYIDLEYQRCKPYMNLTKSYPHAGSQKGSVQLQQKVESEPNFAVSPLYRIHHEEETDLAAVEFMGEFSGSIGMFILFYLVLISSFISITVPYNALIADKSHPQQRGLNSGVMGAMILFGNISGAGLGLFFANLGVLCVYAIVTTVAVICILTTIFFVKEKPSTAIHLPCSPKAVFFGFWEPLKQHDFRWVFITRFLMQQGVSTVIGFLEFWVSDMVQVPHCWGAARAVAILLLPMLVTAAISSIVGGVLSDKLGRRKILVITSGLLMFAVSVVLSFISGKYAYYVAFSVSILFGIGFGCFQSVDFALVMDVLPDEKDKAKDIAVWHQALVLPQAIATPIGGIVLDVFERVNCHIGLGYIIIFLITSVYFLLSALFVLKIKGVK